MAKDLVEVIPQRTRVLGVPVDAVTPSAALDRVRSMLNGSGAAGMVVAVNPEKVIAAQRNPALMQALENAKLIVPDGIGVVATAMLLNKVSMERVAGADLMPEICSLAASNGQSVFLFGAKPDIVSRAATLLQYRFPGLRIAGTQHGYIADEESDAVVNAINVTDAKVLFVGLGSPKQELWMNRNRHRLHVRVCQGVGGTFDAICGQPKRAPKMLQKLHLEWLYRLVTQPQRLMRQSALPQFIVQVVRQMIRRD